MPVRSRQPVFQGPWDLVGVVRHHRSYGQRVHSNSVRMRCCTIVASACQGRVLRRRKATLYQCRIRRTLRMRDASSIPQPPPGGTGPLGSFLGLGGRPDPSQCGVGPRSRVRLPSIREPDAPARRPVPRLHRPAGRMLEDDVLRAAAGDPLPRGRGHGRGAGSVLEVTRWSRVWACPDDLDGLKGLR